MTLSCALIGQYPRLFVENNYTETQYILLIHYARMDIISVNKTASEIERYQDIQESFGDKR